MKKSELEDLVLHIACIKAYFELLVPCLEAITRSLDGLMAKLSEKIGGYE